MIEPEGEWRSQRSSPGGQRHKGTKKTGQIDSGPMWVNSLKAPLQAMKQWILIHMLLLCAFVVK
jgi:hypothetical protein